MVDEGFVCYDTGLFESVHSFDNFHIYKSGIVDFVQQVIYSSMISCSIVDMWNFIYSGSGRALLR